jgi:NTE family protein
VAEPKPADLVLSGGGVKGIGLVGAVVALMDAGYSAQRVSGTSAGSIAGAVVAAASMPVLGPPLALLRGTGIYKGDYAHDWVRSQLKNLGVRTFGDLAIHDDSLPAEQRYKLVVTVADVTTGQLVRLPWDYRRVYGLDPDEQCVADAVRASMAIPFFFRPVKLTGSTGLTSTLVDGGIVSNFPIDSLDRGDGRKPRWPSFGVTVLPNLPEGNDKLIPALAPIRLLGPPHLLENVITTVLVGRDQAYLSQPWVNARTIRVDSTDVGFLDFDISDNEIEAQYAKGYAAAEKFLSTWEFDAYCDRFR